MSTIEPDPHLTRDECARAITRTWSGRTGPAIEAMLKLVGFRRVEQRRRLRCTSATPNEWLSASVQQLSTAAWCSMPGSDWRIPIRPPMRCVHRAAGFSFGNIEHGVRDRLDATEFLTSGSGPDRLRRITAAFRSLSRNVAASCCDSASPLPLQARPIYVADNLAPAARARLVAGPRPGPMVQPGLARGSRRSSIRGFRRRRWALDGHTPLRADVSRRAQHPVRSRAARHPLFPRPRDSVAQYQFLTAKSLLVRRCAAVSHATNADAGWLTDFPQDRIIVAHPGPSQCLRKHLHERRATRQSNVGLLIDAGAHKERPVRDRLVSRVLGAAARRL